MKQGVYMDYCFTIKLQLSVGLSWSWSYGSWIYNFPCNQCLSPLTLLVWIPLRRGILDTTLCDKVCQSLAAGWQFSLGTPVSSINKTDCHDIAAILLKVALNTIHPSQLSSSTNWTSSSHKNSQYFSLWFIEEKLFYLALHNNHSLCQIF